MPSLIDAARDATSGRTQRRTGAAATTHIEVHVGDRSRGDVWEDACTEVLGENSMDLWGTSVDSKDGFRFVAGAPGNGTDGTARVFECEA